MSDKRFITGYKRSKIIQLILLIIIEVIGLIILFGRPTFSKHIFDDPYLYALCTIMWIIMAYAFLILIHDLFQLRSFASFSHALNKEAYIDDLTGIPNRHALDSMFQTFNTKESVAGIGCFMVTIDNLKSINDIQGRSAGDVVIQDFCNILNKVGDTYGTVGRNGGNEFVVVISGCDTTILSKFTEQLNAEIELYNRNHAGIPVHITYASVLNDESAYDSFSGILTAAFNKLHEQI